jgi:muconate cycloisomerase
VKIARVETIVVGLPLVRPLKMSIATVTHRECLLVRVTSDEGRVGVGEAMGAPYFTGETLEGVRLAVETVLAPAVLGQDPLNLNLLAQRMSKALVGSSGARCAVDLALHDLAARCLGVPLHVLLGGALRDRVPATWHCGNMDPDEDAAECAEAVGNGYRQLKVKVGHEDYRRDWDALRAIREAVGDEVRLFVDANQAWMPEQAIAFIRGAERYGLELCEQPVSRTDPHGLARVAAAVDCAVAPDEGVFSAEDLVLHVRAGAGDAVLLKLLKSGGLHGARRLAATAGALGVSVFPAAMPGESSVSGAAMVHLAATLPALPFGTAIAPHYVTRDVTSTPMRPVDGYFPLPQGPGLGLELDPELLAAARLDTNGHGGEAGAPSGSPSLATRRD